MTPPALAPAALLALALAAPPPPAGGGPPHPFHVTIAEVDANAEAGTVEIALRIYNPGDLERALGLLAGERVDLERTEGVDGLILDYLRERLVIERPGGGRAPLSWVGKEVTVKAAWLYVEAPLPGGPQGATFTNTLLFEVEEDQVNTMVFGRGPGRSSLRFTREHPSQTLRASPAPGPSPDPPGAGGGPPAH